MKHALWFPLVVLLSLGSAIANPVLQHIASGETVVAPEHLKITLGQTAPLSGLQVSTMKAGVLAASYAYGMAQQEGAETTPLTTAHKIRVASISKMVMAIGFMQLVEQEKLDLDADISDTLGWTLRNPRFPNTPITARQLLAHTSSLRDADKYWLPAGEQLRSFFEATGANYQDAAHFALQPPGEYFNYANINFGVLASLMELASGERFDRYMKRHVLQPLGLNASYNACDIPDDERAAAFRKRGPEGWNPQGPWIAQVDAGAPVCFYGMTPVDEGAAEAFEAHYVLGSNGTLFSPQGGLRASANDLLVILQLIANGGELNGTRLLSESSVAELLAPEWSYDPITRNGNTTGEGEPGGPTEGLMTSYGLSVHRINLAEWGLGQGILIGHLGEAYGVLSHALLDPATGDGIATIVTGSADDPAKAPAGTSPLYRVEEDILRWWLEAR